MTLDITGLVEVGITIECDVGSRTMSRTGGRAPLETWGGAGGALTALEESVCMELQSVSSFRLKESCISRTSAVVAGLKRT